MSRILNAASMAAVGMTAASMLMLAEPGFASDFAGNASLPAITLPGADAPAAAEGADVSTEAEQPVEKTPDNQTEKQDEPVRDPADTLAELVAATAQPAELDAELRCLAGAVYFESRGESLPGQLAVAHVVINRANSGRFPKSLCGVVHQPSQFSFVRGRSMPSVNTGSRDWQEAVAVAQIALDDAWESPAEDALYFHARRVSPGWGKPRLAAIGNHIFYR